jgi:hypothetical protein
MTGQKRTSFFDENGLLTEYKKRDINQNSRPKAWIFYVDERLTRRLAAQGMLTVNLHLLVYLLGNWRLISFHSSIYGHVK